MPAGRDARFVVRARLQLIGGGQGRTTPIRSGYRPHFECGATWLGVPMQTTGSVYLVDRETLAQGEEGDVRIEPMSPEFWGGVRPGSIVIPHEGSRAMGHATVIEVVRSELCALPITDFVWRAREYARFIEDAPTMDLDVRLVTARDRLLHLYTAAVSLPHAPLEQDDDHETPQPPPGWRPFDRYESYSTVFDPYEKEHQSVIGSLSDDLLDIHHDVKRGGLSLWDGGGWAAAASTWRFTFATHWGAHATDALRALHHACRHALR